MKFLSIFSARRDPDGATRVTPEQALLDSDEAARLFGLSADELTPAVRAGFAAMTGEINDLRTKVDALNEALERAEDMADHDALVPVFNRRAFVREFSRLLAFARRYGLEGSVIFFDLDGFKSINDEHGHAAGDLLLRAIGEMLLENTRESDIIGRLGGDEFAVVLTSVSPQAARLKAEQLADKLAGLRVAFEKTELNVEASWGLQPFITESGPEHHLSLADEAMYLHKTRRKASSKAS